MAIVGAAVASVLLGGALGPKARAVDEVPVGPMVSASAPGGVAGCERASIDRSTRPTVVPPAGPTDVQVNSAGTSAAGGAGTVPGDARGDPCEPVKRFGDGSRAANVATPTTLNRR
jgi:hypothetical protein